MRVQFAPIVAILALVAATISRAPAENHITLNVDLNELRGADLQNFMRAVVPEVYGGESRPPLDLPTLARLHAHYLSNVHFKDRQETLWGRDTQRRLEVVMRGALDKIDLPTLRQMTLGDGKRNYGNGHLYPALCQRWIAAEVAKICSEPKLKPVFQSDPPALPERLGLGIPSADASALHRATGPFAKLLADLAKQKPRGIYAEGKAFSDLSSDFLRERDKNVASKLLSFTWDSWCGTGAEEFEGTKMTLVFMGLLRERRIAEALGVSFSVPDAPEWMREPGHPFDQWRIDLLKFCGFDWEDVMLSAGRLDFLAAAGSEKAARHGLTTLKSDRKEHEKWPWDLAKLVGFLAPGQPWYWDNADPRKAISAQTQADIISMLNSALLDGMPFHELDRALTIFEDVRRPETKETLRKLLGHPSATFAERAAWVLRSFGELIEPIAPAPPVRFRIYLNKNPWRSADIAYGISDPKTPGLSGGSLKTDAEGFATISRDEFLDPAKRGTRIRFYQFPSRGGGRMESEHQYDDPWLDAEVAIPAAFDELTTVHLAACPIPIEIHYGSPPPSTRKATTFIELTKGRQNAPTASGFFMAYENGRMDAPTKFVLSTIAPGEYRLSVNAPGSARHVSEPFEVNPGMPPVQVKLEKGSHVYASIYVPENARGAYETRLFQGDEDVSELYRVSGWGDLARPLYSGLPKGSYQLRLLSTAEFMRKHNLKEWEAPKAMWQTDSRNGVDCEGFAVDFTIDDESPALLDLGRLESKPVPAMRDKAAPTKAISAAAPR